MKLALASGLIVVISVVTLMAQRKDLPSLRVFGAATVIELAPVLVAANGIYQGPAMVGNGGVPTLTSGMADLATNAETQLLRQSVDDPDLRIILTVTENFYRIVARKASGVKTVADLKGKKIAVPRNTSAHYYLYKMLTKARLGESDITIAPTTDMVAAFKEGRIDAVAMWDPEPARVLLAVGNDAIVLQDKSVYREVFNLNTSAKVIADPAKRRAVVEFLRATLTATDRIKAKPQEFWPLVASKQNHTVELLEKSWPELRFPKRIVPDMLDVLEEEEKWVAKERNRTPRARAQLAGLIDDSLLKDALKSR
jgi:NitT/TauT family transport system substrate-binding protein